MKPGWWNDAAKEIDQCLDGFNGNLEEALGKLSPRDLVGRKNPFLFRVRVDGGARQYAQMITDAWLSSSEETRFGNVLEKIAISVCKHARGGWKSSTKNIDLAYEKGQVRHLVQIKSGKNWGNKPARDKLAQDLLSAARTVRGGDPSLQVICIEGICYGPSMIEDLTTHYKYVGKCFWTEISGWEGTAEAVLEVMGGHAGNGLVKARMELVDRVLAYLRSNNAVGAPSQRQGVISQVQEEVLWGRLLELVLK